MRSNLGVRTWLAVVNHCSTLKYYFTCTLTVQVLYTCST